MIILDLWIHNVNNHDQHMKFQWDSHESRDYTGSFWDYTTLLWEYTILLRGYTGLFWDYTFR